VGRAPGGVADIAARVVAQKLTERWKQQVVVDNRPGGSGQIAASVAAQSAKDGYTLLVAPESDLTINRFVLKNWKPYFDEDLVPVVRITVNAVVIAANSKAPFSNVPELVAAAKAKPNGLAFGTAGIASTPHLVGEYFAQRSGISLKHIAYKGGAEAAVAAAGGETPLAVMALSSAVPHVKSGNLKVIGLSTAQRLKSLPDWPTIAEGGLPGFEANIWTALFARTGTPPAVLEKLRAEVSDLLKDPSVIEQLETIGAEAAPLSGPELAAIIKTESERNGSLVTTLKLTLN
jgi:tripartite-type tricarboxylate transporter receptor subunit TctC